MKELLTKDELQYLSDLLSTAIINGNEGKVIDFFNTEIKSDALLKLVNTKEVS